MATVINCPCTDCAHNRAGQCDVARLDIPVVMTSNRDRRAVVYLQCGAFANREAAA